MKTFWIILMLAMCSTLFAREYRSIGLRDRVNYSSIIGVVVIESVDNEYDVGNSATKLRYARGKFVNLIKGERDRLGINLITEGLMPERNPECCKVGGIYLIFGVNGYLDLRTTENLEDVFELRDKDRFISSVDGPYGVFRVTDDEVVGWNNLENGNEELSSVISEIRQEMRP